MPITLPGEAAPDSLDRHAISHMPLRVRVFLRTGRLFGLAGGGGIVV